jgi:preprotein translocase subunit YajC
MFTAWFLPLQGEASPLGNPLFLMLIIFGVFYLIVIRPARKSQRDTETMRDQLKSGDHVLTSGGIYGTVVGVTDDQIQIRVAESVKIQFAKSAIAQLVEEPSKRS